LNVAQTLVENDEGRPDCEDRDQIQKAARDTRGQLMQGSEVEPEREGVIHHAGHGSD